MSTALKEKPVFVQANTNLHQAMVLMIMERVDELPVFLENQQVNTLYRRDLEEFTKSVAIKDPFTTTSALLGRLTVADVLTWPRASNWVCIADCEDSAATDPMMPVPARRLSIAKLKNPDE